MTAQLAAQYAVRTMVDGGSFAINHHGYSPDDARMVRGVVPEQVMMEYSRDRVLPFVLQHWALLSSDPELFLHGWRNTSTGYAHLGVSRRAREE